MNTFLRLLLTLGCSLSLAVATTVSSPPVAADDTPVCPVSSDPNVPIVVTQGDQFVIALASNRSTGYQWQLAEPLNNDIVNLATSQYVALANLPGAGGKECWTFSAVGAGQTTISMKYVRPFDPTVVGKSEDFEVTVHPRRLY